VQISNEPCEMRQTADLCSRALSLTPGFTGKVRLTDAIARFAASTGMPWGTCSPGRGGMVRVNLHDRIERQMWGGCYEPHVRHALQVFLSPGDTFIDVGGHIGYHAVLGASLVGAQGRVIAFEADPQNFARLRDHLGPFPWATAVNRAVWSSTCTIVFERSSEPGESGWGTLTTVRDLKRGEHIPVDTISLDDWLSENANGCVSAIKVDAEGSEVSIFQGATELLERVRPNVIFEANDVVLRQAQTSALALTEIFYGHGYNLFELEGATIRALDQRDSPRSSELLGIPNERARATMTCFERAGFRVRDFRIRNRNTK
jgi:FkbM family methyltransferase